MSFLASISFPPIDPVAVHLGPLAVRWYGLAYLSGFLIAYLMLRRLARSGRLSVTPAQVADLVPWLLIGVMVGGRAGWWLFYHRADGTSEPWYEPLAIWHGGMSFHGGLTGVIVAMTLWCWNNNVALASVADAVALVAPIGLLLGRLANFINAELVGRVTSVPWGVVFPGETVPRHPSQLYEALLEGPLLLSILFFVFKHHRRPGTVAASFLTLYGFFRICIEFFRQPDEQIGFIAFGWLTMGQLLSAVLIPIGLLLLFARREHRVKPVPDLPCSDAEEHALSIDHGM